jgi:hypothetical protein
MSPAPSGKKLSFISPKIDTKLKSLLKSATNIGNEIHKNFKEIMSDHNKLKFKDFEVLRNQMKVLRLPQEHFFE